MKTNKRLTAFILAFAILLTVMPVKLVQASITDVNIISKTQVTVKQAEDWARSKGATSTFVSLAKLYWEYADDCGGVNPGIAYVQAAKETGYGNFGGVLNESYNNPCGMKTSAGGGDYDPNAHQRFNSWDEGVQAQMDHLALYAGAAGYPKKTTFDPRHFVTIKGKAVTVNSLGGNWAPSSTYGEEVNKLYNDLLTSAGLSNSESGTTTGPGSSTNSGTTTGPSTTGPGSSSTENPGMGGPQAAPIPDGLPVSEPLKVQESPGNISSKIGWRLEGGRWYYYKDDGSKATGWIKPGNNWYYLYSSGVMATGWLNTGGTWFYLKPSGAMATGWLKDANKWYYLQGDGAMVTGLKLINGKKYFMDVSGAMRTGWFKISGQWYYFNSDGSMLSGWVKPDGNWYYLYDNGVMATGWVKDGNDWYYLKSSGAMATGWIQDGSAYYYLKPGSGIMARGETIDGWQIKPTGERGDREPGSTPVITPGSNGGKLIVIDPGHNFGGDDGAYATHDGITYSERELNMQVGIKLKEKLEAKGYKVMMTRNEFDRETLGLNQSLTNRVNMANNYGADFFISLHHNSAASQSANGVEVYYSVNSQDSAFGGNAPSSYKTTTSRNMAVAINNAIVNATGATNRGAKTGNLFVCRNTTMPSVLVEFGFISNASEAAKCASDSNQNLSTQAIADVIAANF